MNSTIPEKSKKFHDAMNKSFHKIREEYEPSDMDIMIFFLSAYYASCLASNTSAEMSDFLLKNAKTTFMGVHKDFHI